MQIDLKDSNFSYIFGLFQADANFYETTRNRGKISLEINNRDSDIIYKIRELLPCNASISSRIRDTNFKKDNVFIKLSIFDWMIREEFKMLGLPVGKKSEIIKVPLFDYNEIDYWRGIIDGDGSIGITSNNLPFVSLVTKSEELANGYLLFLEKYLNIKKSISRNKRDKCFNISVFIENAQIISGLLYYPGCLSINRKIKKASEVINWIRPDDMKKIKRKQWEKWEDDYILENSINNSMKKLNRSEYSIKMRIWRLHKNYGL